jgi:hypothetical protein
VVKLLIPIKRPLSVSPLLDPSPESSRDFDHFTGTEKPTTQPSDGGGEFSQITDSGISTATHLLTGIAELLPLVLAGPAS